MNTTTDRTVDGKAHKKLQDSYRQFLAAGHKDASSREAHKFALAMRHQGVTFERSVKEIVIELEGELPCYWTDPFHLHQDEHSIG